MVAQHQTILEPNAWLPQNNAIPVSYTHLRAHETVLDLVCRLLLEKNDLEKNFVLKKVLDGSQKNLVLKKSRNQYRSGSPGCEDKR